MGVKTSILGGVVLSGKAASAFDKQFIQNPRMDNKLAQSALDRGLKRINEFKTTGKIILEERKI